MNEDKTCDLCKQEGNFEEAIGWYTANGGDDYDVCKKHAKEVKAYGFELELFEDE